MSSPFRIPPAPGDRMNCRTLLTDGTGLSHKTSRALANELIHSVNTLCGILARAFRTFINVDLAQLTREATGARA